MPKMVAAVDEHDDKISDLVGYHDISCHLVFDFKLGDNLRRKDMFVADGHMIKYAHNTYEVRTRKDTVGRYIF